MSEYKIARLDAPNFLPGFISERVLLSLHLTDTQRDQLRNWQQVQVRSSVIWRVK